MVYLLLLDFLLLKRFSRILFSLFILMHSSSLKMCTVESNTRPMSSLLWVYSTSPRVAFKLKLFRRILDPISLIYLIRDVWFLRMMRDSNRRIWVENMWEVILSKLNISLTGKI